MFSFRLEAMKAASLAALPRVVRDAMAREVGRRRGRKGGKVELRAGRADCG